MNFARRVLHNILRLVTLQAHTEAINLLAVEVQHVNRQLTKLIDTQKIQSSALGRIIAKVDPLYSTQGDELSKERRAESDRISNAAIDRITAEAKARAPHNQGM